MPPSFNAPFPTTLVATAVPPAAAQWLAHTQTARVLHVFRRACNLVNEQGAVLSLLAAEYGRAPFALTLANAPVFTHYVTAESPVRWAAEALQVGGLTVAWPAAVAWNPVPPWGSITPAQLAAAVALLRPLVAGRAHITPPLADLATLPALVAWLIGRGPGLTPAGDDFLLGFQYGLWARGWPSPLPLPPLAPRTTTLSAAYLWAAGRGEAAESWHNLVQAIGRGTPQAVTAAGQAILATGHTSGADALFGFCQATVYQL